MSGFNRSGRLIETIGLFLYKVPIVYKQCLSCHLHLFIFLLTGVRVEGVKALLSDLRQNPIFGQGFQPHFINGSL